MPSSNSVEACSRALACLVLLLRTRAPCFLGPCFNAGLATENSSEQVLIVLALSCYRNRYKSEARATPVDVRRPGLRIWLSLGVVPPPTTPALPLEGNGTC